MRALAAALGLISAGCDLFDGKDEGAPPVSNIEALVLKFEDQVAALRQLPFKRKVFPAVISRDDYARMTKTHIDSSLSEALSAHISRELAQLGFFRDTVLQYKGLIEEFQSGFAAGFYVPGSDSIFILEEYEHRQEDLLGIIPHELTHALQDQYGRLDTPPPPPRELSAYASDIDWYYTSVIEGEAAFVNSLVTMTYTIPQPNPLASAVQTSYDYLHVSLDVWRNTPRPDNLFLPAWGPYQFGPVLIANAYAANGWDSVNAFYASPWQSSWATINGSERTLIPFDFSEFFRLTDTTGAYSDIGCHGSIGLMAWLNSGLDSSSFYRGMGWRGDQYAYVRHPDQRWGSWIWAGRFLDQASARGAYDILKTVLRNRFSGTNVYPVSESDDDSLLVGLPGIKLLGGDLTTFLLISNEEIYILEGLNDSANSLVAQFLVNKQSEREAVAKRSIRSQMPIFASGRGNIYHHYGNYWK